MVSRRGQLERRAKMWETALGGASWFWRSPPPDFWRVCGRPGDTSLFLCHLNDWTGGLDERLCSCYGEDGGQRLRKPCGCSWLHHWGMRMFISLITWQRFQVVCPFPSGIPGNTVWSCYRPEAAGSGPAYVIRADKYGKFWLGGEVYTQTVLQAGVDK